MSKPLAQRYLSRLYAATGPLSFPSALIDGTIEIKISPAESPLADRLRSAAAADEEAAAEAKSIASARGWSLSEEAGGHERWPRFDTETLTDCLARIYRVLRREVWEARDLARDCDDEEVASELLRFASLRETLLTELSRLVPEAAELGA